MKKRSFTIDLVTIFLIVFASAFGITIWLTHHYTTDTITTFAKKEAEYVGNLIEQETEKIEVQARRVIATSTAFLSSIDDLSYSNATLARYLFETIKHNPSIANIYFATTQGEFVIIYDLSALPRRHFVNTPDTPLPKDAQYALLRTTQDNTATWYYLDAQYTTLAKESKQRHYDPRQRSWYKAALASKQLFWSDIYRFFPWEDLGISATHIVQNSEGTPLGVFGVDVSLQFLSSFLTEQKIATTGRAFIIASDTVIPPNEDSFLPLIEATEAIQGAAHIERDGVWYIVFRSPLPIFNKKSWEIALFTPMEEYFGPLLTMRSHLILIMIAVFIIASITVYCFGRRIAKPIVGLAREIDKVRNLELEEEHRINSNIKEITIMDDAIHNLRTGVRSFARYVPKNVVKKLLERGQDITLGGEKKRITILFTDIAGFSSIAEKTPIDELSPLLEEYFDELSKIILATQGTIDKYIGDGIMAFWGAPQELKDQEIQACRAALQCRDCTLSLNRRREAENKPVFHTRIGINSGRVIVGNIGTAERMNYTVMGDAINTAARLQEMGKQLHTMLIISDTVYDKVHHAFLCRPLDTVALRGRKASTQMYELMDTKDNPSDQGRRALCDAFTHAYALFKQGAHKEALRAFEAIHNDFPDDVPTQQYIERLQEH